jgi:hypothetical protein
MSHVHHEMFCDSLWDHLNELMLAATKLIILSHANMHVKQKLIGVPVAFDKNTSLDL